MRVNRGSRPVLILNSGPSTSFRETSSASMRRRSASTCIVRNFAIEKAEPPRPRRGWRKIAAPGESRRIASATRARSGERTTSAAAESATSIDRLRRRALRPSRIGGSVTTGIPSTSSSRAWAVKISE